MHAYIHTHIQMCTHEIQHSLRLAKMAASLHRSAWIWITPSPCGTGDVARASLRPRDTQTRSSKPGVLACMCLSFPKFVCSRMLFEVSRCCLFCWKFGWTDMFMSCNRFWSVIGDALATWRKLGRTLYTSTTIYIQTKHHTHTHIHYWCAHMHTYIGSIP